MKPATRAAGFRAAAKTWQRGSGKEPAPPSLVGLAIGAVVELEAAAVHAKATAAARCRAALSALDAGDLAQARAVLTRAIDEGQQP